MVVPGELDRSPRPYRLEPLHALVQARGACKAAGRVGLRHRPPRNGQLGLPLMAFVSLGSGLLKPEFLAKLHESHHRANTELAHQA